MDCAAGPLMGAPVVVGAGPRVHQHNAAKSHIKLNHTHVWPVRGHSSHLRAADGLNWS